MNRTRLLLVLILTLALAAAAGCGKKPPVVTETPPPPPPPVTQTAPEQPIAPPPAPTPPPVDYAAQEPQQYGIEDVFFGYNLHALTDAAMATLAKDAKIMQDHPTVSYLLEGHCDERGTVEYNLALGEKRAKVVLDYLVSLGVPAARLKVVSYGKERPFASGHDESAWSQNRRAHFARP